MNNDLMTINGPDLFDYDLMTINGFNDLTMKATFQIHLLSYMNIYMFAAEKGTNPETAGCTAIPFSPIAHPNPPAIGRLKENIKRKIKRIL